MATDKPLNIVWISFEDTTPRFGCYGDEVAQTPHVDRLAAEGCRYPNNFSTAPVCAPARAAIITGMYPTFIGAHHMRTTHRGRPESALPTPYGAVPPPYVKCFTEYLRAAGYYCTNNGKTDYQFPAPSTAWDENRSCQPQSTDDAELERSALEVHWRNRPDPDQPFFAVFNTQITHESGMWAEKGEPQTDPAKVELPPYLPDTLECRKALARQYDHIAVVDRRAGIILRQLEKDGLADNTAVFVWSDHGEGLPRSKRWPYDSGIRVPLIVKWPGRIDPGTVSDRLVSTIDLGPTVLSMCGLPLPAHLQGEAFLGDAAAEPRRYAFATRDRYDDSYDMIRAVRTGRYKYLRNYHPELPRLLWVPYRNRHPIMRELYRLDAAGELTDAQRQLLADHRPPEELYDTETDPWETHNLADDPAHAEVLSELRGALDDWRRDCDRWGDVPESQMKHQFWEGRDTWPQTQAPRFVPVTVESPALDLAEPGGGRFDGPFAVQLHCPTQGASIEWTDQPGPDARWRLYTGPLRLDPGAHTLRARATRIGYQDSHEVSATFEVA